MESNNRQPRWCAFFSRRKGQTRHADPHNNANGFISTVLLKFEERFDLLPAPDEAARLFPRHHHHTLAAEKLGDGGWLGEFASLAKPCTRRLTMPFTSSLRPEAPRRRLAIEAGKAVSSPVIAAPPPIAYLARSLRIDDAFLDQGLAHLADALRQGTANEGTAGRADAGAELAGARRPAARRRPGHHRSKVPWRQRSGRWWPARSRGSPGGNGCREIPARAAAQCPCRGPC